MTTFHTVKHDDFGAWVGLSRNKDTAGSNTEVQINSPYSTNNIDDPGIQNYIDLNAGLTPTHSCEIARDPTKRAVQDSHSGILQGDDRAPVDEMVLMGRVVQDGTGASHFTYSEVDGVPCDGFAQFLQPAFGQDNNYASLDQNLSNISGRYKTPQLQNSDQLGTRINLQFDDLPAFTWVPVWGIGYGHALDYPGNNPVMFSNAVNYPGANDYRQSAETYPYLRPECLSSTSDNLFNDAQTELSEKFTSNTWYIVYCHDGAGNAMLASCWGMSATGNQTCWAGSGNSTYNQTRNMNASNAHWGTHHGKMKYTPNTQLQNLFNTHASLQDIWDHYGTAENGGGRRIVYPSNTATPGETYSSRYLGSAADVCGNISLIAYGPTSNPTLSSPTNVYVNHFCASESTTGTSWSNNLNKFGSKVMTSSYSGHGTAHHRFVTGKVGDLMFYNHPTIVSAAGSYQHYSCAPGLARVLLHATHLGGCRINSFSMGAYTPVTNRMRRSTAGVLDSCLVPYSNMEFIYPGSGVTFNPVSELSNSSTFVDDGGAWTAPVNMFDATPDTFATVTEAGIDNALHIPLNGVSAGASAPADVDPVQEFSILVRGIRQQDIQEYELVFAITDQNQVELITTPEHQRVSISDSAGGTIDTNTKYPMGAAGYLVSFRAVESLITYGDIRTGYLKMYVVPRTSGNFSS